MNSPHLISKVFFNSVLLPAHITVSKSFFMNSNFMISKALLDIILLTGHSTLSEWRWTVLTRPGSSVLKKGVARNFEKKAVKSTIFKLEQSFLHIFGVAQNFQLNGGGCLAQRGGGRKPKKCVNISWHYKFMIAQREILRKRA